MKEYHVFTGDGNDGTSFDHTIEAESLDAAVKVYMEGVDAEYKDLFTEDGDDMVAYLTVYEGPEGESAYNGGAYFCCEIWDAEHCERHVPA